MSVKRSTWFRQSNKLRRTLGRMEPEILNNIKEPFKEGAEAIKRDAIVNASLADYGKEIGIKDKGDMIDSISVKFGRDGLTAVIGPGAKAIAISKSPFNTTLYTTNRSKYAAWQFFKGYWAEFGTKGDPKRNIPAIRAAPFMQPAYDENKGWILKRVKDGVHKALISVTGGQDYE